MDVKSASRKVLKLGKIQRRPELDALRGLFLVWMTLTHLPTRVSELVNQPFGFVSSAEGFVFLSAMLVATLYIHKAQEDSDGVRSKLWMRALRIYGYHLIMLAMGFTDRAAFAAPPDPSALFHLPNFYRAHPATAIVGSLLLIYCPPLLDILPMYVIFLLASPFAFWIAVRRSWRPVILGSTIIWLLAQFHLRIYVHDVVVHVTHLPIPL